jgi:hypothetical protein
LAGCESSNTASGGSPQSAVSKAHVVIVDPNQLAVSTRIVGGSGALRSVIKRSLAGIGQTAISEVVVSPAGGRYRPVQDGGVVLGFYYPHATQNATFNEADAYAQWQAGLVATATRDRSRIEGFEPVIFYRTPSLGGRIDGLGGQQRPISPTPRRLIRHVRRIAAQLHASIQFIGVLQPRGLALHVELDVPDPARFLRDKMGAFTRRAFPTSNPEARTAIDGWYIELHSNNELVAMESANVRMSEGSGWTTARLLGCVSTLGALGAEPPPPCPVEQPT